jgi:DNA polymerase III delta prime subunit
MDAQSALRRCIELFSHNTRFFIIVEDKYKMLKPILSRFCEIYIPEPEYNGKIINLYKYNLGQTFKMGDIKAKRVEWLRDELDKVFLKGNSISELSLLNLVTKLYEKSYSALDIIQMLEDGQILVADNNKQYELLIAFNKVRKEFRNEKLLMLFVLNFIYLDTQIVLENISFM